MFSGKQNFVQTRQFKGVAKPLVSSGTIELESDSVVWTVTEPVGVVTTINKDGIFQSIEGSAPERISGSQSSVPLVDQSGLFDLLKGDLSRIDEYYVVTTGADTQSGWAIALTPRNADMKKFVDTIKVDGCNRVSEIRIEQSSGDTLAISFPGG